MLPILRKLHSKRLLATVLIIFSLFATCCKIYVGLDNDEVFITYLATRLAEGRILFADSWDVYVTSSIIPAIFIRLFLAITHSVDGVIIYLRVLSAFAQCFTAYAAYRIFRKHYSAESAFFAAIVILGILPRSTQNFEYGFISITFFILSSLMLFDVFYDGNRRTTHIFIAGVFYGLGVFTYPTMLISLPFLTFLLLIKIHPDMKVRIKFSICFWSGCVLLFILFMSYILLHMSINDFLINLSGLLECDDHSVFFSVFRNTEYLFKLIIRSGLLLFCTFFLYLLLRIRLKLSPIGMIYIYMMMISIIIIGANITSLRASGPFGLLERYIIYAVMAVIMVISSRKHRPLFFCFTLMGIFTYLGALAGSNLGYGENAMYLEPALISLVISAVEYKNTIERQNISILASICIIMMLAEIIFSKAYFVRIDGTSPANINEPRIVSEEGPSMGIMLYPEHIDKWNGKRAYLNKNTFAGSTYVNIGSDTMLNYFYKGEMVAPQYAGTLSTGKQWVDYYTIGKRKLPDYIYVDKMYHPDIESFLNTAFGQYINDKYIEETNTDTGLFHVLKRSAN